MVVKEVVIPYNLEQLDLFGIMEDEGETCVLVTKNTKSVQDGKTQKISRDDKLHE